MDSIIIAPVEWSRMKDIDDIAPVSEADYACMRDVRDALQRHNMLDRFGLALLHTHFDLQPDEVWLEEVDSRNRQLVTRPVKDSEAHSGNVGTVWQLMDGEVRAAKWCRKFCRRHWLLGHGKDHNSAG